MDQNIIASSWSTCLFSWDHSNVPENCIVFSFVSKYLPVIEILLRNTAWNQFTHILAAFHKKQERLLVIVALKWYHQTEKYQRTAPEKLTLHKMEPAANNSFSCKKSVLDRTWPWPYHQLQNRHEHEADVTVWLSYCGTSRHWQLTSHRFLHWLNGDTTNCIDAMPSLKHQFSLPPIFPWPPSRGCHLYSLQWHAVPLPE